MEIAIITLYALLCGMEPDITCLPDGIDLKTVVEVVRDPETSESKKLTVKEKLNSLRAKCREGKLVDGVGREIRFFHLQGCWGNPPADYLEILGKQSKEIEELKKNFTVVELTCNPAGVPLYSIV